MQKWVIWFVGVLAEVTVGRIHLRGLCTRSLGIKRRRSPSWGNCERMSWRRRRGAKACALMEERERRRDTFTVKGLVHDSHFYVNARPEVKCCQDAQQTPTRQTQSKGVLIGASLFTTPSLPPSLPPSPSPALILAGLLSNGSNNGKTTSSETDGLFGAQ